MSLRFPHFLRIWGWKGRLLIFSSVSSSANTFNKDIKYFFCAFSVDFICWQSNLFEMKFFIRFPFWGTLEFIKLLNRPPKYAAFRMQLRRPTLSWNCLGDFSSDAFCVIFNDLIRNVPVTAVLGVFLISGLFFFVLCFLSVHLQSYSVAIYKENSIYGVFDSNLERFSCFPLPVSSNFPISSFNVNPFSTSFH